jgi:putative ABC transport system permease protein
VDKVVFIPIEGIFRMDGHVLRGAGENYVPSVGESIPQEHREVSAVLLDLSNPQVGFSLSQRVNRQGRVATLAFPIGRVVGEVFDKLGWAHRILGLVSILVMFIAASSIVASLIQSLSSRERDFAILRALGMPRRNLIWLLVLESALVSFLGSLGGFMVYGVALLASSTIIRNQTGVVLDIWSFHPVFIWGPMLMTGLSATVGLLPAWRAYSSPVAEKLKG